VRARNIKPALFKNEHIADLNPFDRLLFIGLWCMADREGRLEDRPKRIKMELFPCDNYDVEAGLLRLQVADGGLIRRYEVCGFQVISVTNFLKHQNPHGTEADSLLPNEDGIFTKYERNKNKHVSSGPIFLSLKEMQDNGYITVTKQVCTGMETVSKPPDSLIPDSLIPESPLNPPRETGSSKSRPKTEPCPHSEMQAYWNKLAADSGLRRSEVWPEKEARAAWRNDWFRKHWGYIFQECHENTWCRENHQGPDHVLRVKNARKYYEEVLPKLRKEGVV
jgi:hypothetical protein